MIAYHPGDNSFYHWSGNGTIVFERVLAVPPYTVTNVVLADARSALILAAQVDDAYQTGSYKAGEFANNHDVPSVTTTGPYTGYSGGSVGAVAGKGVGGSSWENPKHVVLKMHAKTAEGLALNMGLNAVTVELVQ